MTYSEPYNKLANERPNMNKIVYDISRDGPVGKLVIRDNVYDICIKEVDYNSTSYEENIVIRAEISYKSYSPRCSRTYNPDRKDSINEGKVQIKNVIFSPPATIVLWSDGSKTVVKAENEIYDPEKGLAMALAKKALGNQGNYFETFKKYVNSYKKKLDEDIDKFNSAINTPKKPYKIWYETKSGVGSFKVRDYIRKGNAIKAAKKMFEGTSTKWLVSQDNPWNSGEWKKEFGSDE